MRSHAPILNSDVRWSEEIACGHTVPLRVQEDLQREVTSLVGTDDKNSDIIVGRVVGVLATSGDWWILRHWLSSHCAERDAGWGVQDGCGKLFTVGEFKSGGCAVGNYRGVGVGSPLEVGTSWDTCDIVLDQDLFSAVQESDTSSDRG